MTEMLRILPYNSVMFDKGIVIGDAYDVRVTYEINGERRLDFSHPINEKSEIISCYEGRNRFLSRGEAFFDR